MHVPMQALRHAASSTSLSWASAPPGADNPMLLCRSDHHAALRAGGPQPRGAGARRARGHARLCRTTTRSQPERTRDEREAVYRWPARVLSTPLSPAANFPVVRAARQDSGLACEISDIDCT